MEQQEIIAKLRHIMKQSCREKVDWDTVTSDTLIGSLGFDSLSILDLVYDVQQGFGISFEAESLAGVKTIGQLADFLKTKIA